VADALAGNLAGKRIGVLGLTFEARHDDMRERLRCRSSRRWIAMGATVQATTRRGTKRASSCATSIQERTVRGSGRADCAVIITNGDQFARLDLDRVFEGHEAVPGGRSAQHLPPRRDALAGFTYLSVGRT